MPFGGKSGRSTLRFGSPVSAHAALHKGDGVGMRPFAAVDQSQFSGWHISFKDNPGRGYEQILD